MDIDAILMAYQAPAVFFGAFFFGETVVISAAFIAGQGVWPLSMVFWLSFLGTVISDVLWFLGGRSIFERSGFLNKRQEKYREFLKKIEKLTGERPFLSLLFVKFLYGGRVITIIYLSLRGIKVSTFILFDLFGTLIWLTAITAVGWFAGKGLADLTPVFNKTGYAIMAIAVIIIAIKIVSYIFGRRVDKEES